MSELAKRVITGLALAALVLSTLFALPPVAAVILFALFLGMGCWEWSGFMQTGVATRALYLILWVAAAAALFLMEAPAGQWQPALAVAAAWWVIFAFWLFRRAISYGRLLTGVVGLLVLVPAWLALLVLLAAPDGNWLFVWMAATVAAADIGAYFTGKALGRRKLAPQISPGKTVEGLLGGLAGASLVCAGLAAFLGHDWLPFALGGPLVALVSVAGDLTVSAFKRNAGLKDAGWVLPGHGGVMDRVDGLVAAAPVFVLLLSILQVLPVE